MTYPNRYQLDALPTLESGWTCDLKYNNGRVKLWLSRLGTADGEPFEHTAYVDVLTDGRWVTVGHYDASVDNHECLPGAYIVDVDWDAYISDLHGKAQIQALLDYIVRGNG